MTDEPRYWNADGKILCQTHAASVTPQRWHEDRWTRMTDEDIAKFRHCPVEAKCDRCRRWKAA